MSAQSRYAMLDWVPWVRDTAIAIYPDGSRVLVSGGQDSAGKVGACIKVLRLQGGIQVNSEGRDE